MPAIWSSLLARCFSNTSEPKTLQFVTWGRYWHVTSGGIHYCFSVIPPEILPPQQMICIAWLLLLPPGVSHVVAEHDILFGELKQHRIVEELVDADVFTQTLETRKGTVRYKCRQGWPLGLWWVGHIQERLNWRGWKERKTKMMVEGWCVETSGKGNWRKWLKIERYGDKYYQSSKILAKPWCLYDVIDTTIFRIQMYLNYLTLKGFQPSLFENKSKMSSLNHCPNC